MEIVLVLLQLVSWNELQKVTLTVNMATLFISYAKETKKIETHDDDDETRGITV